MFMSIEASVRHAIPALVQGLFNLHPHLRVMAGQYEDHVEEWLSIVTPERRTTPVLMLVSHKKSGAGAMVGRRGVIHIIKTGGEVVVVQDTEKFTVDSTEHEISDANVTMKNMSNLESPGMALDSVGKNRAQVYFVFQLPQRKIFFSNRATDRTFFVILAKHLLQPTLNRMFIEGNGKGAEDAGEVVKSPVVTILRIFR
jgi:hypothetical protein